MQLVDLTGQRFGMLVVMRRDGASAGGNANWLVRCDCGKERRFASNEMRRRKGPPTDCGCLAHQRMSESHQTHGMTHSPTYQSWRAMIGRCEKPGTRGYNRDGGRGITGCDRWRHSFESFLADMGERPSLDHSVERKDVNANYEPSNCRWATRTEQCNNRRSNRRITYDGRTQTLVQWAREFGFNDGTLARRLDAGWSVHDTITQPKSPVRLSLRRP